MTRGRDSVPLFASDELRVVGHAARALDAHTTEGPEVELQIGGASESLDHDEIPQLIKALSQWLADNPCA